MKISFLILILAAFLLPGCEWKDHPHEIPAFPKEYVNKEIVCIGNAKYGKFEGEGYFLIMDKDGKVYPC